MSWGHSQRPQWRGSPSRQWPAWPPLVCSNHKRFPSTGSCAEAGGGSSSLQTSPIRSLPHWNSQCSMPSTPDLRVRSPHYVHSTRWVSPSPSMGQTPTFVKFGPTLAQVTAELESGLNQWGGLSCKWSRIKNWAGSRRPPGAKRHISFHCLHQWGTRSWPGIPQTLWYGRSFPSKSGGGNLSRISRDQNSLAQRRVPVYLSTEA